MRFRYRYFCRWDLSQKCFWCPTSRFRSTVTSRQQTVLLQWGLPPLAHSPHRPRRWSTSRNACWNNICTYMIISCLTVDQNLHFDLKTQFFSPTSKTGNLFPLFSPFCVHFFYFHFIIIIPFSFIFFIFLICFSQNKWPQLILFIYLPLLLT
jgi:hypothetical protein